MCPPPYSAALAFSLTSEDTAIAPFLKVAGIAG